MAAVMTDKVIEAINIVLKDNVSWLDNTFGKSERYTKSINGKTIKMPCVWRNNNEYLPLFPDKKLGNFSFFIVSDPQIVLWREKQRVSFSVPFSIVFWGDTRTIFDNGDRNIEQLKNEVIMALNKPISYGRIELSKMYVLSENIYREYTINEIDNQYLTAPYFGFRFEGNLIFIQDCI